MIQQRCASEIAVNKMIWSHSQTLKTIIVVVYNITSYRGRGPKTLLKYMQTRASNCHKVFKGTLHNSLDYSVATKYKFSWMTI